VPHRSARPTRRARSWRSRRFQAGRSPRGRACGRSRPAPALSPAASSSCSARVSTSSAIASWPLSVHQPAMIEPIEALHHSQLALDASGEDIREAAVVVRRDRVAACGARPLRRRRAGYRGHLWRASDQTLRRRTDPLPLDVVALGGSGDFRCAARGGGCAAPCANRSTARSCSIWRRRFRQVHAEQGKSREFDTLVKKRTNLLRLWAED
jgi:hypothetical protein